MRRTLKKRGAAAIVLATLLGLIVMAGCGAVFPSAARWLIAAAGVHSLVIFAGLTWALDRSDAVFYGIFAADLFLRLIVLGLAVVALEYWRIPLMTPLLCLAAGYLGFSLIQIPFLHRMPLV